MNPKNAAITEYLDVTTLHSEPAEITVGPDGNLWFTEFTADRIGTFNPTTDTVVEHVLPTVSAQPEGDHRRS